MRIKRFIAPDMRTALRMVRDEQGPDAVILSNRPTEDGIEIVAATDYDESLAQQALRAALPALAPAPAPVASPTTPATAAAIVPVQPPREALVEQVPSFAMEPPPSRMASLASLIAPRAAAKPAAAPVAEPVAATAVAVAEAPKAKIAESPIRGRAVFSIGEPPANAPMAPAPVAHAPLARARKDETRVAAAPAPTPDTSRFDAMMAALIPAGERFEAMTAQMAVEAETTAAASSLGNGIDGGGRDQDRFGDFEAVVDIANTNATASAVPHPKGEGRDQAHAQGRAAADLPRIESTAGGATSNEPRLHAVPDSRESDPGLIAMREELATMRQLIERELSQMSTERLRGSPARAAAYDMLMGYGCDESLAQTVAGRIDARLDPSQVREPMLAELARMLSVARHEPLDDGGVIALVGPTGAGKTTTAAKLAARFAQRHRARDVALVTTDTERAGATEQLHILGRRLGVTVCEANGPEALNEALDQLADYPLVLVDTAGHGLRDRALLGQILWLRAAKRVRSLLVLPANSNAHDLGEVVRRYRPASPEGVVLTKLDETGRLGTSLSVLVQHGLSLAYTTDGQHVPTDLAAADATALVATLEKVRRAADNPLGSLDNRSLTLPTEDRHAIAS